MSRSGKECERLDSQDSKDKGRRNTEAEGRNVKT